MTETINKLHEDEEDSAKVRTEMGMKMSQLLLDKEASLSAVVAAKLTACA
jgi:hypothetical protein